MDAKECREAFEAWAKSSEWDFESLNRNGAGYHDTSANEAWHVWQAAWNRRADAQDAAEGGAWSVFNGAGACVAEGMPLDLAKEWISNERFERGWTAVAIVRSTDDWPTAIAREKKE